MQGLMRTRSCGDQDTSTDSIRTNCPPRIDRDKRHSLSARRSALIQSNKSLVRSLGKSPMFSGQECMKRSFQRFEHSNTYALPQISTDLRNTLSVSQNFWTKIIKDELSDVTGKSRCTGKTSLDQLYRNSPKIWAFEYLCFGSDFNRFTKHMLSFPQFLDKNYQGESLDPGYVVHFPASESAGILECAQA